MSLIIAKKDLSEKEEAFLLRQSKVREITNEYKRFPKTFKLYLDLGDRYVFPRGIGLNGKTWQEFYETPKYKITFESITQLFTGNEGDNPDVMNEDRDQQTTVDEGVALLKTTGAAFYHFSTGYGKTQCAIETVRRLGRTTLWVAFGREVQQQTYKSITETTDAETYWYRTTKEPPSSAQIVIVGLVKAKDLSLDFLSRFQTVVLDEVDQTAADSYFPLFLKICPTYILGLSATIKKSNGLEKALFKYFGKQETFLYRFIQKPNAKVIKFQTEYIPTLETKVNIKGQVQLDKDLIYKSLAEMKPRNKLIVELIKEQSSKGQVLVLSARKENIIWISERLTRDGYENDYKTVGKTKIDKTKPILIGGLQGCGRGFDTKAKILILLDIPPNLTQFIGRLRDPEGTVYIFVDRFERFEEAWNKKCMPYLKKLGCQLYFQIQEGEVKPYEKKSRVIESYLDD
jgi:hypothetical protein